MTLPPGLVPAVFVAVYATLFFRWRYPYRVFWIQCVFAAVALAVPNLAPFVGLLIGLHAVASRLPTQQATTALVSVLQIFGVQSGLDAPAASGRTVVVFLQFFTLWTVVSLAVWGAGRLSYTSARRALRLQQLQAAEAVEAVQAERLRLARELHDIVAHSVTVMTLQASGAQAVLQQGDEDRVRGSLVVIEQAGVQAMAELHRLLGLLRSVDPQSDATADTDHPTVADIVSLVELARASGQRVDLQQVGESGPLDPSVEVAAYRLVQEGLTNVTKHGGPTAEAEVSLEWRPDLVRLAVRNDLPATSSTRSHVAQLSSAHGLQGLRERVGLVGGTFAAGPVPGGFEVTADLPRSGASLPGRSTAGPTSSDPVDDHAARR
ncbi:MAG: histidine kinase [Propionibacteriaceae bacterium]